MILIMYQIDVKSTFKCVINVVNPSTTGIVCSGTQLSLQVELSIFIIINNSMCLQVALFIFIIINNNICLQVALFQLPDVTLMVSVFMKRGMKRKDMVGWFALGFNNSGEDELTHWNQMRDSKGEQVCQWHVLLES